MYFLTVTTMVIPGVRQWPARTAEILFKAEIRTSAGAFPSLKKEVSSLSSILFFTKITHSQQFYRVCFTAHYFWNFCLYLTLPFVFTSFISGNLVDIGDGS